MYALEVAQLRYQMLINCFAFVYGVPSALLFSSSSFGAAQLDYCALTSYSGWWRCGESLTIATLVKIL